MFLSDAELTAIRADVARMLPGTAVLLTATETSDGQGGFTTTWGTASTVACRLDAYRGSEQVQGAALKPFRTYVLTLPHNTTITEQYRVQIGTNTYSVTSVDTDKSWKASMRVYVEKL